MGAREPAWWAVRMVVEISSNDGAPESEGGFMRFEDRIVLVKAFHDVEARKKGEASAAHYQETSSWKVLGIVDVQEILDAELGDGVEIYSAFIDREWVDVLMKGADSPVSQWKRQNPGKDVNEATVQEIIDAWEHPSKQS